MNGLEIYHHQMGNNASDIFYGRRSGACRDGDPRHTNTSRTNRRGGNSSHGKTAPGMMAAPVAYQPHRMPAKLPLYLISLIALCASPLLCGCSSTTTRAHPIDVLSYQGERVDLAAIGKPENTITLQTDQCDKASGQPLDICPSYLEGITLVTDSETPVYALTVREPKDASTRQVFATGIQECTAQPRPVSEGLVRRLFIGFNLESLAMSEITSKNEQHFITSQMVGTLDGLPLATCVFSHARGKCLLDLVFWEQTASPLECSEAWLVELAGTLIPASVGETRAPSR